MIALILLTGLRGWAGDAMAMEMSRKHSDRSVTTSAAALIAPTSHDAMPCHGEGAVLAETDQTAAECTACQVCHSPALQTTAARLSVAEPLASYAGQAATNWVSADLTHLQKPPVS